uniref:Uncharacterized protein n=2 Tax=Rhipicephalus TaxID=426455 RepID=A0A131YDF5_RHIAP
MLPLVSRCSLFGFFSRGFSSVKTRVARIARRPAPSFASRYPLHLGGVKCMYVSAFNCLCAELFWGCAFVDCYFWKEVSAVFEERRKVVQGRLTMCTKEGKKLLVVCFRCSEALCLCFFLQRTLGLKKHAKDCLL